MIGRRTALLAGAVMLAAVPAEAQSPPPAPERRPAPSTDRTTSHTVNGQSIQATVSTIRLVDQRGAPQAEVVTTAFALAGADPATRPVTFAINGGPGASSAWLNLGAIGPWRVPFGAAGAPPVLQDNAESWLDLTDLVFIDPPGTGFSRVVATGDEAQRQFWSVQGDIEGVAAVARRWLEANRRMLSPKFIVGESYGGFRGPKLARALLDHQGIGIAGLVLVSPVLDFNGRDAPWNQMRFVWRLPGMAAAARGATSRTDVADVEAYATGDYLRDLLRGPSDAEAVERLATRVAAITGLEPGLVRRRAGRIDIETFLRDREPGRVDSPYDATVAAIDPFPAAAEDNSPDPILDAMRGPLTEAMLAVYATRLNWQPEGAPERQYEILSGRVGGQWDYGRRTVLPNSYTDLRQFLALDPNTRVVVAHGLADLVTPYLETKLLLDQTPPYAEGRLSLLVAAGGHMFYAADASRAKLHAAAASVIQGSR